MFENIISIFKRNKKQELLKSSSKDTAKERLHLVLMQDRANVSADFLDLMRKEIVEVIKKYIDIDEKSMDVRLTTETNEDGTQGAPALYANIAIINIKEETRKRSKTNQENKIIEDSSKKEEKEEIEKNEEKKENAKEEKVKNKDEKSLEEIEPKNESKNVEIKEDEETEKESTKNEEEAKEEEKKIESDNVETKPDTEIEEPKEKEEIKKEEDKKEEKNEE